MPFDPNAKASADSGIFGLESKFENSRLVLLPVPFEATTSYRTGTIDAPVQILEASKQVDLYHDLFPEAWKSGFFLMAEDARARKWNSDARSLVESTRENHDHKKIEGVNKISAELNAAVLDASRKILNSNKILGLIGGDHAVPFGCIQATLEKFPKMGILHIDAHFDLRNAYEGFSDSHASIMYNVATRLPINSLVQVGLRDFCQEEIEFSRSHSKLSAYTDRDLFSRKASGESWKSIASEIVKQLPNEIYVSFDVDGLDPTYCPNTGTPVPGGLSFQEVTYLLREILVQKKKLIGFDLVEVGSQEYDSIVGARLLYEMACLSIGSQS